MTVQNETIVAAATYWNEDTIQQHPAWERELELERGMQREGADIVRDRVAKAREKGQGTRLEPVRHLMHDWLPRVAEGLADWKRSFASSRGPKPIALEKLRDVDNHVASLIGLRFVLNNITKGAGFGLVAMATDIGRTIEHEQQVRLWMMAKEVRASFHAHRRDMTDKGVTDTHRAIVNTLLFNRMVDGGELDWQHWTREEHFRVGMAVVENIFRITQWFTYAADPEHTWTPGQTKSAKTIVAPKAGLMEWLFAAIDKMEVSNPMFTPTVVPPKRWDAGGRGGYWTPYVRAPRLIRFKASQEDQQKGAAQEYDALEMPAVYDALHFLQEVPWRVNRPVFEAAMAVIQLQKTAGEFGKPTSKPLCGIVPFHEIAEPRPPWGGDKQGAGHVHGLAQPEREKKRIERWIAKHPEEHKAWKRKVSETYRVNLKNFAKARSPKRTLRVAQQHLDDVIYFPHMMDFRGRMYPIPVGLQPQGDDLARGLLMFAEGKPVTEANGGVKWLAIAVATAFGMDKVPFEERLAWVQSKEADWRKIAADPIANIRLWSGDGVSHFQALAAVLEWVGYLDEGEGYISHLPVSVDGTCNGIQHLSAMTRDADAGAHVNLIPSDRPQDIYKHSANLLFDKVARDEAHGDEETASLAGFWMDLIGRDASDWSRKMTKRQVMVVPYGGTRDVFFTYTRDYLDEVFDGKGWVKAFPRDQKDSPAAERQAKAFVYLTNQLWNVVHDAVPGATKVMKWLQDCAKAAAVGNQPIFWGLSSGFQVRHFYGQRETKDVKVNLDGHLTMLKMEHVTTDLDKTGQVRGIAPNFVHSLDAEALRACINMVRGDGVTAFSAIHDAYGTHAADMEKLYRRLREAFVELHSMDVLGMFKSRCAFTIAQYLAATEGMDFDVALERADDILLKAAGPAPIIGTLELTDVLASPYFFA